MFTTQYPRRPADRVFINLELNTTTETNPLTSFSYEIQQIKKKFDAARNSDAGGDDKLIFFFLWGLISSLSSHDKIFKILDPDISNCHQDIALFACL